MNIIPEIWQFAEAAAHEEECQKFSPIKDAKNFVQTKTDESYAFIAQFPEKSIISFKGTKNNIKSWIYNFDVYPLKGDERIQQIKQNLVHTKNGEPGIIHKGFYLIWERSKKMVDDFIAAIPKESKIIVTGMSQGGAIASICARHLAKNRDIVPDLITFAAPAQGTLEYATQLNDLILTHYRTVNGYDIVPTLPPVEAGFVHSGLRLDLFQPWWHKFLYRIKDHYYSLYTKALLNRFKKSDEQQVLLEVLKRVYN